MFGTGADPSIEDTEGLSAVYLAVKGSTHLTLEAVLRLAPQVIYAHKIKHI